MRLLEALVSHALMSTNTNTVLMPPSTLSSSLISSSLISSSLISSSPSSSSVSIPLAQSSYDDYSTKYDSINSGITTSVLGKLIRR
jgi:hypothetical protein